MSAAANVSCPHCKGLIAADPSLAGQRVACPHCGGQLTMPAQTAAVQVPEALPVAVASSTANPLDFSVSTAPYSGSRQPVGTYRRYGRKKKGFPIWLGIVLGGFGGLVILGAAIRGCSSVMTANDPDIAMVRNGSLHEYPNITVGKAVKSFMGNPQWESGTTSDGTRYVNVRGTVTYLNKEVDAVLQFEVHRKAGTFEVRALEFNGVPQNRLIQAVLLTKMFEGD